MRIRVAIVMSLSVLLGIGSSGPLRIGAVPRVTSPVEAPAFPLPVSAAVLCTGEAMDPYCEGWRVNCPAEQYWDDDNCIGYDDMNWLSCNCTNAPGTRTGAIWICTIWYPQAP